MQSTLRTIVIDSDPESRASLRRILGATPSVVLVGEFAALREALLEAPGRRPDIVIAEIPTGLEADSSGASVPVVQQLAQALPEAAILATAKSVSAEIVLRVIRAGALEFLPRPVERTDLLAALEKVGRMRRGSAPSRRAGRVTSVFSPKGGLGVTTVAMNVAICMAEQGVDSTLLVELDTRQSDIATFLDLRPPYSVLDAFENVDRMDESFLRGLLTKHSSGLWVLPGPARMERAQLSAEQVHAGLEIIRSHFDNIVLDLRHDLDPATIVGLEASDIIVFLTSLTVPALRSGAAALAAFRHLGVDLQRVKVVVMREDTGEDVTLKHARETLGLPVAWKTPSDYQAAVAAINSGRPVVTGAPRSKIAKNLRQLAEILIAGAGTSAHTPAKRSASLLGMVWSPKGAQGAG